jgi:hypothetical protein
MTSKKNPERGMILMLDALGISSYSLDECRDFLDKFSQLEIKLQQQKKGFDPITFSKFTLFGDTVIVYWPFTRKDLSFDNFLLITSLQISEIFEWGLENKIPFRGSIAIGDYLDKDNFILGSAMFDAHDWCEVADWFGIICTPKTRLWIESVFEKLGQNELEKSGLKEIFIEYKVPLAKPIDNEKTKNFLTFNWCYYLSFNESSQNLPLLGKFLDLVYEFPMNKHGERKISNGVKYFRDSKAGFKS